MADIHHALMGKFLERAGHPTTPDAEALVAIRKAYSHCKNAGKHISDAVLIESGLFFRLNKTPANTWMDRIEDAEERAEIAEARTKAVIAQLADLKATYAADIKRLKAKKSPTTAALKKVEIAEAKTAAAMSQMADLEAAHAQEIARLKAEKNIDAAALERAEIAEAKIAAVMSQMAEGEVSHAAAIAAKDVAHAAEIIALRRAVEAGNFENAELRKKMVENAGVSVEALPEIAVDVTQVESVEAKVEPKPVNWTRRIAATVNRLLADATSPAKIAREVLRRFGVQSRSTRSSAVPARAGRLGVTSTAGRGCRQWLSRRAYLASPEAPPTRLGRIEAVRERRRSAFSRTRAGRATNDAEHHHVTDTHVRCCASQQGLAQGATSVCSRTSSELNDADVALARRRIVDPIFSRLAKRR